jgi:hypothetical protein
MKQWQKLINFVVLIAIWGMTVDTVKVTAALSPDAYSWRYDLIPVAGAVWVTACCVFWPSRWIRYATIIGVWLIVLCSPWLWPHRSWENLVGFVVVASVVTYGLMRGLRDEQQHTNLSQGTLNSK